MVPSSPSATGAPRRKVEVNLRNFLSQPLPTVVLNVQRGSVLDDSLDTILKLALTSIQFGRLDVNFVGEPASGPGVLKEFFAQVSQELFHSNLSMFRYFPETRLWYFNPCSLETPSQFCLVGSLACLAIMNGAVFDVDFPSAFYMKLQDKRVGLDELAELDPEKANSYRHLLGLQNTVQGRKEFEDAYENLFNFTVTYDFYGEKRTVELIPGGESKNLTFENKSRWVEAQVDWILNKSVEEQFGAFKKGFHFRSNEYSNKLFRDFLSPTEFEQVFVGETKKQLDFSQLASTATYEGGYSKDDTVVRWLWNVLNSLEHEQKLKFLQFLTASKRVPIGGLKSVQMRVVKSGTDSSRLPAAYTCYNLLLLPVYQSEDELRSKLITAISQSEGFGLQ